MRDLPHATALAIYDILVRHACARASDRLDFAAYFCGTDRGQEWRFQGTLGFGGKIRRNCGEVLVTCYREDETTERLLIVARCNTEIRSLTRPTQETVPE